jgi:hypothetical protein
MTIGLMDKTFDSPAAKAQGRTLVFKNCPQEAEFAPGKEHSVNGGELAS